MYQWKRTFVAALAACLVFPVAVWAAPQQEVTVFAAASLRDVLTEIATVYQQKTGVKVSYNFAGSNVLARQIVAGAQADMYISANVGWIKHVGQRNRSIKGSKQIFLSNNLVVVGHPSSKWQLQKIEDLATTPFRFLSIGDPEGVPAGKYAKRYLSSVKMGDSTTLWHKVNDRLSPAPNVRVALGLVESDPSVLGIVYGTDAKASSRVKVLYEVPANRVPIQYGMVRIKGAEKKQHVMDFFTYLLHTEASDIFKKHGFKTRR